MKYTLKTKKIKIWVTEVVCNLLMNNLTTNKFKQFQILCDRGAYVPSPGNSYTVCITFLQPHRRSRLQTSLLQQH